MNRTRVLAHLRVALVALVALALSPGWTSGPTATATGPATEVVDLRVENTTTPLGLDVERPRFSWVVRSSERGVVPAGHRIVVSTSADAVEQARGDVWDSGDVSGPASSGIGYDGPTLEPATRYFWRVLVRTEDDPDGTWSSTSWFETGLGSEGWDGSSWITAPRPEADREPLTLDGAHWAWHPEGNPPYAPEGDWYFRLPLPAHEGAQPTSAEVLLTADDSYRLFLDGERVGASPDGAHTWMRAQRYRLGLGDGPHVLGVSAHNSWEAAGAGIASPAGLLAKVRLSYPDGSSRVVATGVDSLWRSHNRLVEGWAAPELDAAAWSSLVSHAAYGGGPWGRGVSVPTEDDAKSQLGRASWIWYPDGAGPEAPAGSRFFRKDVHVDPARELVSADLIMTADDKFTAFLNGAVVGRSGTSAEAWREAQVLPLDVAPGRNTVAVEAVNSNFASGGPSPAGLLGVVRLTYAGGAVELVPTGGSWRSSQDAPSGWREPGFDDTGWRAAVERAAYGSGPWGDNVVIEEVASAAPVLRSEFELDREIRSARLYLAGAGLVEARLNGTAVGDEVLSVSHTDYTRTVHYATHDVTDQVEQGANALLFELGRGFYSMQTRNAWNWDTAPWWQDEPAVRAVLRVTYADGTTEQLGTAPASWRQTAGPTTYNSLYEGDFYDARRELPGSDRPGYDDSGWAVPAKVAGPAGKLTARVQPPIRVVETIAPTRITEPSPGVYVAAFPQQVAGWARIEVDGQAGDEVQLRYGERLLGDGNVSSSTGFTGGDFQTDRYTLAGRQGGEVWEPSFSYKGFKYVEITGWPAGAPTVDDISARLVHTDVSTTSTFDSSEPLFDKIHEGVLETMLNNFHHVPTDTPTYEKNGWTGDAQLGAEMFLRNFDSHSFLTKWLDDVSDSRNEAGRPALIAPDPDWNWGGAMESPTWHAAYVLIPWWMYEYTGDTRVIEKHYDGILKYLRLEHRTAVDHISSTGLGDYMSPDQVGNPPEDMRVSATAYVHEMTRVGAEMAELLGKHGDAQSLRAEASRIKDAFNAEFYDPDKQVYRDATAGYRQTHNVLALAFGLVPEGDEQEVADHLARDIREKRDGHLWTGVLGTKYLLPILTEYGHGDLAYTVATQTDYPSWGRWFESAEGSTTMWEAWDDYRSRNHYFLGTIDDWFFEDLVGITSAAPGYREISVAPQPVGDLTRASGSTKTPLGRVGAAWERSGDTFTLEVEVPVGATTTVSVPVVEEREVSVNGVLAQEAAGVTVGERSDGRALFTVGSGTWRFRTEVVLTTKAECKRGGWRDSTLPVFANQGQCVSSLVSRAG